MIVVDELLLLNNVFSYCRRLIEFALEKQMQKIVEKVFLLLDLAKF